MTDHRFQAEVSQVLHLVIHSLYSHKEIFLRELLSNASDALDKLRFRAVTEPEVLGGDPTLEIRIRADAEAKQLILEDTGIGMTEEELVQNLGTVAHSGSRAFLEELAKAKSSEGAGEMRLIGQFGVGFYSAFLVSDKVEVETRAASSDQAFRWSSDGQTSFTTEAIEKATRGTRVILHLKKEHTPFLEEWTVRDLVRRYSDYVNYPIKLEVERAEEKRAEGSADGGKKGTVKTLEQINEASALWRRPKSEITDEQYGAFYKHLTHDFEPALAHTHFRVEGREEFTGLLYVPKHPPFDLGDPKRRRGVRLFVRRVFVMDDCEEILPPWLRFVRGVVDSDDLPLNVSRELLQESATLQAIKKQVTKKTLDLLADMAKERPGDYETFWKAFGTVLKEAVAMEPDTKEKVAPLLRYESTASNEKLTSLGEYVSRIKEGQEAIYYLYGESKTAALGSPYLEALRAREYEVLLMTDPVDEWAADGLRNFEGKPLVSAMRADLKLKESDEEKREKERFAGELGPIQEVMKKVLASKVRDVKVSDRLTDSPACLVLGNDATPAFMEKLLRDAGRAPAHSKRILEVNPKHPLIQALASRIKEGPEGAELTEWVETLYDQAVLAEGGTLEDPNRFAKRVAELLTRVATR